MNEAQYTIIVDIDGTLSDPNHRRHHVEGDDKNWEVFFEKVNKDPVNEWCRVLVQDVYHRPYNVVLVTGRPDTSKDGIDVRSKTLDWLNRHGIPYDKLVMRNGNDFRKDTVVKQEILDEELPDPEDILFAVDDRKDIAEMWRENGITCLQCKDEVKDK